MKRKTVALYDPYLDTLGGGEKHILSIIQALNETGYKPYIFWDRDLKHEIKNRLNIQFNTGIKFIPNIFKNKIPTIKKLIELRKFDIFFYVTDGSYFFSTAKNNYVFCMVPDRKLFEISFLNRLKTFNYRFITNSIFTKSTLSKLNIKSQVIYPYIDDDFINKNTESYEKDKIILTVGRFFKHLHSKRQDIAIEMFKKIKQTNPLLRDYKLILAGGLREEDQPYFDELTKLADNDGSIIFKPNIPFKDAVALYKKSMFYWHFAGFGVDEETTPELTEHLGITPLEAMASGCITLCYDAGGPKEIIQNAVNGFLFDTEQDLINKIDLILKDPSLRSKIQKNAERFIEENFSYEVFKRKVAQIIK